MNAHRGVGARIHIVDAHHGGKVVIRVVVITEPRQGRVGVEHGAVALAPGDHVGHVPGLAKGLAEAQAGLAAGVAQQLIELLDLVLGRRKPLSLNEAA